MSKRVIFISLLLILIGLWSIWDMIAAFLKGSVVIDTSFLFLQAGCGLLMGHRYARTMASVAFGLFYLQLLFAFVATAAAQSSLMSISGVPSQFGPAMVYVVGLFLLALALFIHWQLYTPPFDEHLSA